MLVEGIKSVLNLYTIFLIFGGTFLGAVMGAIPGLTVTMGVALFLPVTFVMSPVDGLSLLMALYIGGTGGGLISAVLLKIPGTPSSIATTFDGHPMAERGEAGRALSIGIICSFLGGIFSLAILYWLAPQFAKVALQFGSFEYFAIALFSLTLVSSVSEGSIARGIASAGLGLTVAFIGMAPITAYPRFTFGWAELDGGISLLPALIGLFAVSQVLQEAESVGPSSVIKAAKFNLRQLGLSIKAGRKHVWNFVRSSLIGVGIGILPGLGGSISNLVTYGIARKYSKYPEKFGTGVTDGLVASESANNATTGGALIPLMTLGIPGDNTTAILLAGFMIHGITPSPELFQNNGVLVYGIFTALFISNVFMLGIMFGFMKSIVRLLSIPKHILLPVIMILCVVGSYGINNRIFDVGTMIAFGVLGWIMSKAKLPVTPLLLGFILGPIIEVNLRRGLMSSRGEFMPFITNPFSGILLALTVVVVLMSAFGEFKKGRISVKK